MLFLFCVLMAISRISVHGSSGTAGAISGLLETLVWALIAGLLFILLFINKISENFTVLLFGGRSYCDETPMSLSHARGFIAAGDYEQAALLLQELYATYHDSPELNLLIFEFYLDNCKKTDLAFEFAGNYLKSASVKSPDNLVILMRYCDLCIAKEMDKETLTDFLLDESTRDIYPETEKKSIFERVKGLNS